MPPRGIPIHKNPQENAFGLKGSTAQSDCGILFIKKTLDSRNIDWDSVTYMQAAYVCPPGGEEMFP